MSFVPARPLAYCKLDRRRRVFEDNPKIRTPDFKGSVAERAQLLLGGIGRIIDTCSRYLM
jgi:hypothetical protein